MSPGPLASIRVLEVGDLGEVAGKLLAEAGADVVRVEPLSGAKSRHQAPFADGVAGIDGSLVHAFWNTDKRSVALDIADSEAEDVRRELVQWADVVLDGSDLDFLDALQLGRSQFEQCEGLIWCSITPWGLTGPRYEWSANDLVNMAQGGIVMMCGYDDHQLPPVRPDGNHSLAIAGEYAVVGILAALLQRENHQDVQWLDVSIHEAVAGTTEGAFMNWEYLRRNPSRTTGRHAGTPERWQLKSADGDYLVLFGGGVPRERKSLDGLRSWMTECGFGELINDPSFDSLLYTPPGEAGELRSQFAAEVASFVSSRPTEEVYRRGQAIGMPWAPVRLPEENLADPHWEDRAVWVETEVPGSSRKARYPRAPFGLGDASSVRRAAARLGEHSKEVITGDLGFSEDYFANLQRRNVVGQSVSATTNLPTL